MNEQLANISVLETLQDSANAQMGVGNMSVFNATFSGESNVKPEQQAAYQKVKDAIIAADTAFIGAMSEMQLKEDDYRSRISVAEKAISSASKDRDSAAQFLNGVKREMKRILDEFQRKKSQLEAAAVAAGVKVHWEAD